MHDAKRPTRRTVLGLGLTATASLACGGCASMFRREPRFSLQPTDGKLIFDLAAAPELKSGPRNLIVRNAATGARILVFRKAEGEIGATAVECTHKTWDIDFDHASGEIRCPAHGSRFGPDGGVIRGPATKDLRHYPAEIVGETVQITVA